VLDGDMRKLGSRPRAEIDARAGTFSQFVMPRDEICMHVGLDNVLDLPRLASRRLEVYLDIPLGIDDGGDAPRPNPVRCGRQAAQIESFNLYRFHAFLQDQLAAISAAPPSADRAGPDSSPPDTSAWLLRRIRQAR